MTKLSHQYLARIYFEIQTITQYNQSADSTV